MSDTKLDAAAHEVVAKEWSDDYKEGAELFCATFGPEDFADPRYTIAEYPEGANVAVLKFAPPPPGWVLRNLNLSEDERSKLLLVQSSCPRALDVVFDLNQDAFQEFFKDWTTEASTSPGKSQRSSKQSGNKKPPSDVTS